MPVVQACPVTVTGAVRRVLTRRARGRKTPYRDKVRARIVLLAARRWSNAAIAVEVFGDERVVVEPRLDEALEAAVTLAEEEAEYAGAGVLVTGSVITVGEARLLLGKG